MVSASKRRLLPNRPFKNLSSFMFSSKRRLRPPNHQHRKRQHPARHPKRALHILIPLARPHDREHRAAQHEEPHDQPPHAVRQEPVDQMNPPADADIQPRATLLRRARVRHELVVVVLRVREQVHQVPRADGRHEVVRLEVVALALGRHVGRLADVDDAAAVRLELHELDARQPAQPQPPPPPAVRVRVQRAHRHREVAVRPDARLGHVDVRQARRELPLVGARQQPAGGRQRADADGEGVVAAERRRAVGVRRGGVSSTQRAPRRGGRGREGRVGAEDLGRL